MPTYKIVGKIQKVTYGVNNEDASKIKSISIKPDQEYSLKNGDKNYAMLMPEGAGACQALAVEYKKETEFDFQMAIGCPLQVEKRVLMTLRVSSCDAIKVTADEIGKAADKIGKAAKEIDKAAKEIGKAVKEIKDDATKITKATEEIKNKPGEITAVTETIIPSKIQTINEKAKETETSCEVIKKQLESIDKSCLTTINLKSDSGEAPKPVAFKLVSISLLA